MTLLGFFLKIALIWVYLCTRGGELLLEAFNNAFKKLLDR
mgnify:CR=1 FL=1